jgi:hypothetical protein
MSSTPRSGVETQQLLSKSSLCERSHWLELHLMNAYSGPSGPRWSMIPFGQLQPSLNACNDCVSFSFPTSQRRTACPPQLIVVCENNLKHANSCPSDGTHSSTRCGNHRMPPPRSFHRRCSCFRAQGSSDGYDLGIDFKTLSPALTL